MTELVLKNIPQPLYQRLQQKARQNQRSLDREVIAALELIYGDEEAGVDHIIQRARLLRSKIQGQLTDEDLAEFPTVAVSIDKFVAAN